MHIEELDSRVEGEVEGTDKFQMKSVTLIDHVRNHGLSFREASKRI